MSWSVSPAIATAVRASISMPVRAVVDTVARIVTACSSNPKSIDTASSGTMCARGMSSLVRFAPEMPAIRAVGSTSAFFSPSLRTSATTSAVVSRRPSAIATRRVTGFAPTSTMRARPSSSRWVSEVIGTRYRPGRRRRAT